MFDWIKEAGRWVCSHKRGLVVLFAASFVAATPFIWKGSWGLGESELVTGILERELNDSKGNRILDENGNPKSELQKITLNVPGKALWAVLELLGVPLVLVFLGSWLQRSQQKQAHELQIAQQRQAANETSEEVLQLYFDRISALLVDKNLMALAHKEQCSQRQKELLEASLDVIRARTLSILRRFENDTARKSDVVRFLAESEIISKLKLQLSGANLSGANLSRADLSKADLSRTNLSKANLSKANISETKLVGANLVEADLKEAKFLKAGLGKACLFRASLQGADFTEADLRGANLVKANLQGAYLNKANLSTGFHDNSTTSGVDNRIVYLRKGYIIETNLSRASLSRAYLMEANLNEAILVEVNFTVAKLHNADLSNAISAGPISKELSSMALTSVEQR